ncbi:hypothetical protein IEO21_02359 [Rhodonia placenta]|uniref:Mediator of RNA polymerase II transcription subunit 12 n=1 Tax=Rhodonia placenta TaxID=104341 RepID=A0A8H7P7X2_9APHY|nr:hypothetical protein IEO21_02359 [Postia placenta]
MAEEKQPDPPPIYELHPPEWVPRAHASADLGYVGFFAPRPDDAEEVLTETNVKNGLILDHAVPAESYSAQDTIKGNLLDKENALSELEDLLNQVFVRKAESIPQIPSTSFRMPSRVTLNDTKREAWFADLANPDVPLYKLGKNVPHGAKGHDLLDLLHTKNVAIPRAVWFLRVFGGNETAGLRNKPGYNPTQYSVEWANVVTSYLKKQLTDIALPTAHRLGLNIKQTFKNFLADTEARERWISRLTYSLKLLHTFYAEGLVDNRTFLAWLVQQMGTCNLAQLGFVAHLADEYLDGMLISRALTHHFVEACLARIVEIHSTSAKDHLANLEDMLKDLLSRCFLAQSDAFVSPRAWMTYGELLEDIFSQSPATDLSDSVADRNARALHRTFLDRLADVQHRNEAMLFRHLPPRVVGSLTSALADIRLLNSLSGTTDMDIVVFFDDTLGSQSSFARKLDILLTWSVTSMQYGDHRPYAAGGLLRTWRHKVGERAIRHEAASPDEYIQDQLFDWLDSSQDAAEPENLPAVSLMFGQLVKDGLFSYQAYIQRLIARGEDGLSFAQAEHSRHRDFLRWIPLHSSDASLTRQRKVALYGVRARETPEDVNEREIRKEIRALLPEVFEEEQLTTTFWSSCSTLLNAPRYEQVRTVNGWLLPILRKHIKQRAQDAAESSHILRVYTLTVILMAHGKCYSSILELTLFTLEHTETTELLTVIIETLCQHMEVWACMNRMRDVTAALYGAHQFWRAQGVHSRALMHMLLQVDQERFLETEQRQQVLADVSIYTHALQPTSQRPETVPVVLPEILLLATDLNPEAASNLAKNLWYKFMTASDWAWKVWDNTIASLRQIPAMVADIEGRRACALRYAHFLRHIDQHLPRGFDKHVLEWFLGAGKNEVAALCSETWDVVMVVLLHLCVCGALTTTTILHGLIYPVWQAAAAATSSDQAKNLEVLLAAANSLFERLLLRHECATGLPPQDVFEAHGLQTRRRDVFREAHFISLVDNIPTLVLVEHNAVLVDNLRQGCMSLRQAICQFSVFRLGVYRDLDAVQYAFEKLLEYRGIPETMYEPLITALRLMLRDPSQGAVSEDGFVAVSSLLTPWKLAATAIEIRLTLKQLGEGLTRDSTRNAAQLSLNRLTTFVFQQCKTPEEADFVAEMMTEVSQEVAGKFVNAGLQRVVDLCNAPCNFSDGRSAEEFVANTGEVLRLLSKIVERFRNAALPPLMPHIQDKFVYAFCTRLNQVKDVLTEEKPIALAEDRTHHASHCAIFLARLLQFDLGFPGAWTAQVKSLTESLCKTFIELIMLHGHGSGLDVVAFPLLLDTLYCLLDEMPVDPKATTFDPFRNYPEFELSQLPVGMPPEHRSRMRALLPYVALNQTVADLAYATRDASGALHPVQPVQNRPWEWTEHLGDIPPGDPAAPAADKDKDGPNEHATVRNSASLALELFAARMTGETLVPAYDDARVDAAVRTFQEGTAGESVFIRDWRETRVALPDELAGAGRGRMEHEDDPPAATSSQRASPALSVRSGRGSAHPSGPSSTASIRQSPAQGHAVQHQLSRLSVSTSATSEIIDVDSFDVGGVSGKRKATSADIDDEIEIIEGPSKATKKPRAKASSKTKTKKR